VPIKHVSNSAAVIDLPEVSLDMVRPGIMLYGFYPSKEVKKNRVKLKPAMRLVTELSHKKYVEAGKGIGYGLSYTTKEKTLVGTLPLGYADGLNRSLSNRGYVALRGKKAPIVGRICMDQCMIDLTGITEAMIGDRVIVFGDSCEGEPHVDDVSELRGTIAHEVICNVSRRVPRVYLKDGEIINIHYYF
jgi:alanine racemase